MVQLVCFKGGKINHAFVFNAGHVVFRFKHVGFIWRCDTADHGALVCYIARVFFLMPFIHRSRSIAGFGGPSARSAFFAVKPFIFQHQDIAGGECIADAKKHEKYHNRKNVFCEI